MKNYEADLTIDQDHLDKEWRQQPSTFMAYYKESVTADMEARRAKEKLELVKVELYLSIRGEKEAQGGKFTEAVLDAEVKISDEYQEALTEYNNASAESEILSGAVKAFDQRKAALENLVKLHIAGYFSSPKETKGEDNISSMAQDNQRAKLNKRRA